MERNKLLPFFGYFKTEISFCFLTIIMTGYLLRCSNIDHPVTVITYDTLHVVDTVITPKDRFGLIEGYITRDSLGQSNIEINLIKASINTGSEQSSNISKDLSSVIQLKTDTNGYFAMRLISGTYLVRIFSDQYERLYKDFSINISVDSTEKIAFDLNNLHLKLKAIIDNKIVRLSWIDLDEKFIYRIYSSKNNKNWDLIKETNYSNCIDTVNEYGVYYYRIKIFGSNSNNLQDSSISVPVVYTIPDLIKLEMWIFNKKITIYGKVRGGYEDYSQYRVLVYSHDIISGNIMIEDTVEIFLDQNNNSRFIYNDTVENNGNYFYQFSVLDKKTNTEGDLGAIYSAKVNEIPTKHNFKLTDNFKGINISIPAIAWNNNFIKGDFVLIFRSKINESNLFLLDTLYNKLSNTSNLYYHDIHVDNGIYKYAIAIYKKNTGVLYPRTNAKIIIHSNIPKAPSIASVHNAMTYMIISFKIDKSPQFISVLLRKDTANSITVLDTINNNSCYYDCPQKAGYYYYSITKMGYNNTFIDTSTWKWSYFSKLKSPGKLPEFTLSNKEHGIEIRVRCDTWIDKYIVNRSYNDLQHFQPIDTLETFVYEYFDTLSSTGLYHYSVDVIKNDSLIKIDTVKSINYHKSTNNIEKLMVLSFGTGLTIRIDKNYYYDSLFIYRSRNTLNNFTLIHKNLIPSINNDYYYSDTLKNIGSGIYFYKYRLKKNNLFSEESLVKPFDFNGILKTPRAPFARADSQQIKVFLHNYRYNYDTIHVYQSAFNDLNFKKVFSLPLISGLFDSLRYFFENNLQPGTYYYKIKAVAGILESPFSPVARVTFPGLASLNSFKFPLKGSVFKKGDKINILWYSNEIVCNNGFLHIYKNDIFVKMISNRIINNGKYLWTIPDNLEEGSDYQIVFEWNNWVITSEVFEIVDYE